EMPVQSFRCRLGLQRLAKVLLRYGNYLRQFCKCRHDSGGHAKPGAQAPRRGLRPQSGVDVWRTGEEVMLNRLLWSMASMALACSPAWASDIRRVVPGLDADNKAIALFDSRVPLAAGPFGLASVNLWITDSYPPTLVFSGADPATKPIGISP